MVADGDAPDLSLVESALSHEKSGYVAFGYFFFFSGLDVDGVPV